MLPVQELATSLNLVKRDLVIPLDAQKFFYVDVESVKVLLDQVLEFEETDMKFFNVKQSQPYSNSLDKATIVNNSNATVTQQETFTKTTTDSFTFTNTKGFSKGASVNATIGTPFAGGVGTTLNLSFNLSVTASTAKTVSLSRSQQQTITVPAQTSLVATWVIKNVDIDAEYKMALKIGPKPVIKHGLIPGKLVASDQPIVPVYRYTDNKGEKFMYFPSNELELENWYLDGLNPVFFIPQPPNSHFVQAGGSGSSRIIKSLFKGHSEGKALVAVSTGSAYQDASAQNTQMQESFQVNSQYSNGAVSLWRYRKDGTTANYRLEASNNPEHIPGWINEGAMGFVFPSIPGMKDVEIKTNGHPHALNEIVPEKDKDMIKKKKCGKCWKKIDPNESYFRCEQCKTFIECSDCYQASDRAAQKAIDEAVTKFHEILERLPDSKKVFNITGKMHGTQGTHTFISISPLNENDKETAQQHTSAEIKQEKKEEDKEEEKSHKAKKYIEEFKYTKQYVEEESDEKSKVHSKTETTTQNQALPLPPPPPPLPTSSSISFQEPLPLPPPPPPLPQTMANFHTNPYYTTPLQSFINNPSTVQPYFAPPPAPPPPPPPGCIPGPLPAATRTIETTYVNPAPPAKNGNSRAVPAVPSAPPPSTTTADIRRGSIEDIYSIPMHMYSSVNSPHAQSPAWGGQPHYEQQQNYDQQNYEQQNYNQQPQAYNQQQNYNQNYNQQNYNQQNYNPQNYNQQNYNQQSYQPPYEQNYNQPNYNQQNYSTQQNYDQNYEGNYNVQQQKYDLHMSNSSMPSYTQYQQQPHHSGARRFFSRH